MVKDDPQMLLDYSHIKKNLDMFMLAVARQQPTCVEHIPNPWVFEMPILEGKKRHYWIWSDEPDTFKTTFLKNVARCYRASWYTTNENF